MRLANVVIFVFVGLVGTARADVTLEIGQALAAKRHPAVRESQASIAGADARVEARRRTSGRARPPRA
jgi:hypothetical protein